MKRNWGLLKKKDLLLYMGGAEPGKQTWGEEKLTNQAVGLTVRR